ncbi:MAG: flavodoxin family protein [Clostridiales bacterium]|nr:flavodoxin family protein [Clostridiales bacterium]
MSIAIVWSSPNGNGLTASAKNAVLEGIQKQGMEYQEYHLNTMDVNTCLACSTGYGLCKAEGSCVLEDDFQDLYHTLCKSDGIVLVTAVYWHDMTEVLKSFMDRLRRCETAHNHHLEGKPCMLIACAGGSGNGAIRCLFTMEHALENMKMTAVERLPVTKFNRSYLLPALTEAGAAFCEKVR